MFDPANNFRFWYFLGIGNMFIYLSLYTCYRGFGAIRNKPQKVEAVFFIFVAILTTFVYKPYLREMAVPNILSGNYEEMNGVVYDYKRERENERFIGGKMDVTDSKTGEIYRFRDLDVPPELRVGDSVGMVYLKYYRTGACVEVNGKARPYNVRNNHSVGVVLIILLLSFIPYYYLWRFKIKPFFDYIRDYSIYTYHDVYVKVGKILYLFMIQSAVVLFIALLGYYKSIWEWYWGFLLLMDYAGIFCLSFLHQKEFVIVKDTFYYCACRKRAEGKLEEIEGVEKTEKGVVILANGKEIEIFCTSDRYRDVLMEKLVSTKGGSL